MPNLTGQMLGKVRVDMFLARGGMADVFIGTHTTLHRAVAIKFLKGDLQDEPELRERFEREARVIAMLRHPNIVHVYDFDTFENQPYLVMEYVPGTSLGAYLRDLHKNNQRLDITQINGLLNKLANALKYGEQRLNIRGIFTRLGVIRFSEILLGEITLLNQEELAFVIGSDNFSPTAVVFAFSVGKLMEQVIGIGFRRTF